LKALRVSYKVFPDAFGSHTYSAMLNIQLALPHHNAPRTKRIEVLIDSGASRCLFQSEFAAYLGIDLTKCPTESTMGIGGIESIYLHDAILHVPGGPVTAKVGFKRHLPVAGLLGMTGFFEHFRIVFDGPGKYCELERIHQA
jgi:hypothetical protein